MRDIYIPNMLRTEKFKEYIGNVETSIPYILDFDVNQPDDFSIMLCFAKATVLENLLIFDKVYLDAIELPAILMELLLEDEKSTFDMIKRGYISYLDVIDVKICTRERNNSFTIAGFGSSKKPPKTAEELKVLIKTFFGAQEALFSKIEPYVGIIFENRKSADTCNENIPKELCHIVDKELKSGMYKEFGIGLMGTYYITRENRGFFDAICAVVRNEYISKKFGLYAYYTDDVLKTIVDTRYRDYLSYNDNMHRLLSFNEIPDFKMMYLIGRLSIKDFLTIKNKKVFQKFREWLFSNSSNDRDIAQDFFKSLKRSSADSIPMKIMRFMATTGIGAIPIVGGITGAIASAVDTFFVDSIVKRGKPESFVNYVENMIKTSETINENEYIVIGIKYNPVIKIDNSTELEINKCILAANDIQNYTKQMNIESKDEAVKICDKSREIFLDKTNYYTLREFLKCLLRLSCILPHLAVKCALEAEEICFSIENILQNNEIKELYFVIYYNALCNIKVENIEYQQNIFKINNNQELLDEFVGFCRIIFADNDKK